MLELYHQHLRYNHCRDPNHLIRLQHNMGRKHSFLPSGPNYYLLENRCRHHYRLRLALLKDRSGLQYQDLLQSRHGPKG